MTLLGPNLIAIDWYWLHPQLIGIGYIVVQASVPVLSMGYCMGY
jgi:hypothetical protein